ncbi:MFS transporter [Sneathiella litorea]|uniref:MFS transporter n=1 Tax=Sneathiella litorea TaxID=2606216 RepID=A0A6L8W286_9PROT|nr:MFS transporter [Sneathiella litorea]MZR29146.1 MFS transporter [Sneathiella litorea]
MAEVDYTRRSAHLRMSLYYIAFFSVYGIAIPLWPRWLEHYISVEYVGVVMGAAYWAKLIFVPVTSWIADVTGNRRNILIALALFLVTTLIILPNVEGWLFYALIWGAAGAALSSAVPLSDGLTLRAQQTVGLDFGKARLWGSMSFIAFSLLVGSAADYFGINAIYVGMLLTAAFLLLASLMLPAIRTEPDKGKSPFFKPLVLPNFPLFVITVSLLLSTHAGLYGFSAIHWANLGYSNAEITLFWVIGVVAEIGMFAISGRLIARFGATPMIAVSALGGMVRWVLIAVSSSPIVLGFAQTLHALTFALLYMSFIGYIGKRVPPAISASAQGLYDSLAMGIFFGIFTIAAGWLHQRDGSYSFLFMAFLSTIGLILALVLWRQVRRHDRLASNS